MKQEQARIGWLGVFLCIVAVLLFNLGFEWLWRIGDKLEQRSVLMVISKTDAAVAPAKQS